MPVKKIKLKNAIDTIAVFWIIISTGSLTFCIFNMKFTMFTLLGIAFAYLLLTPGIGCKQFGTLLCIVGLVIVNGLLNFRYLQINDDIAILLIRLFSIAVICTYVTKEKFMIFFCRIIFYLSILSLICFLLSEIGITLPGQTTIWFKDKYYIYTVYHTLGRWSIFHRNAGIFWESPAFAIFINMAIAFLMLGDIKTRPKKKALYLIVYSITLFSTRAITGYIEFFIVLLAIIFRKGSAQSDAYGKESKSTRYAIGIVVLAILFIFLVQEFSTHMISNKIINRQGSYWERSNDTIQALLLGLSRPLTGYGLFNNHTSIALNAVNVTDNSNSFTSMFMYLGVPLFCVYVGRLLWGLRQYFNCSMISFFLVCGAFIIFLNSEQIAIMTLFLVFLFPVQGEHLESAEETICTDADIPEGSRVNAVFK